MGLGKGTNTSRKYRGCPLKENEYPCAAVSFCFPKTSLSRQYSLHVMDGDHVMPS